MPEERPEQLAPAVVARARQGDIEAFGELFRQTQTRIYNFVRSRGLSPEDAADVTQRVYVSAWKGLRRLRSDGAFLVWLHRIALNAARDTRQTSAPPTVPLQVGEEGDEETAASGVADAADGPDAKAAGEDLRAAVRQAIQSLPEIHRTVVTMHHLEEMDVTQIAEVLGVPSGTVLSRLARAREALRSRLSRWLKE